MPAQVENAPTARGVLKLEPFKVTGSSVSANEAQGTEPTEVFEAQAIEESGAFDLEEFFSQLPASPAGEEQLVLVDGQPRYLDISKLPLEMIASIEVSHHGALPELGAYANGRVINIRLKTNYRGEHLMLSTGGSFLGDGLRGNLSYSGAVKRDKVHAFYSVNYRKQDALMASDRSFSREQDHRALGGRDLRLLWGDPAVVQAAAGNLAGVRDALGQPTSVALAPEGRDGRGLTPADFLPAQVFAPATVATAAGQRRFNTSDHVTLITPSEEKSANFSLGRPIGKRLEVSLSGSLGQTSSERSLAPPVTAVSADTLVPAAYNPFGQDVQVGLVHTGFGPVRREDRGTSGQLGLNLKGRWADTWEWFVVGGGRWNRSKQQVRDLDREAFTASLSAADPAQRFNPFGDDPRNALLYPGLAVVRGSETKTSSTRLDFTLRGQLGNLPGGPARLVLNGDYNGQVRTQAYENPAVPGWSALLPNAFGEAAWGASRSTSLIAANTRRRDNTQGGSVTLNLPWVGQKNGRPGLRRLDSTVMTGYSARSSTRGGTVNGRFGLTWAPHKAFSLRGTFAATRRAPSRFLADAPPLAGETLIDPLRFPATAPEVQVIERDFDGLVRSRGETLTLNGSFEPPFVPGLQFNVTYDRRQQQDLTSSPFKAQDLIYNELTFPGRVVRAAPDADDLRLGQPGRIVSVDTTPSDQAAQESSNLTWRIQYRRRSEQLGLLTLSTSVEQALTRRYEVRPGVPFVFESNNNLNPPAWTQHVRAAWSRQGWRLSVNFNFRDEVRSGAIVQPATRRLGAQVSHRFAKPIWGRWGRGLHVGLNFEDLLEGEPPFADTINGYRTGSPLGRTWTLTMRLPLQRATGKAPMPAEDED